MSGTGHSHQKGTGLVTATALLHSSGGMLGLLGAGATSGTAALSGTGTVVASSLSFFHPGTSGPSSGTSFASAFTYGIQFKVTASGHHLAGYYLWVQAGTNPNPTGARICTLYTFVANAWSVVSGSTVTSGTLTTGWNLVSLGSPVSLVSGQPYEACAGQTGNFNETDNQFGSGDPFSAGITNGDLFAYSDSGGSAAPPTFVGQCLFGTGSADPTVSQPLTSFNSANFWMDVNVT